MLMTFSLLVFSIPVWSRHHPQIPRLYVPQWTQDMKNRNLILEVFTSMYSIFVKFFLSLVQKKSSLQAAFHSKLEIDSSSALKTGFTAQGKWR